jgi:hypothetical protein
MDNGKEGKCLGFHRSLVVLLVLTVAVSAGCEPLRKKFTRQKKEGAEGVEMMPILDPIDYPEPVKNTANLYRQHYSLWQVWLRDFSTAMQEGYADKKIIYDLNQMIIQLQEMQKLVEGDKQVLLKGYEGRLEKIKGRFADPSGMRNNAQLQQNVESVGKEMRQNFRFQAIEANLVK